MSSKIKLCAIGVSALIIGSVFTGCGGGEEADTPAAKKKPIPKDTNQVITGEFNGRMFSIPSPMQTAQLIEQSGAEYNSDLLNSPANQPNYSTKTEKALNLGIYGADLGYITIFDHSDEALSYLHAAQKLAEELQVEGAFDGPLLDRIQKNLGDADSMGVIVQEGYRAADSYLKKNDRTSVAGLILAGGWIEAMHFSSSVALSENDKKIKQRIAAQKQSLESIVELLRSNEDAESYEDLLISLDELMDDFSSVVETYEYKDPTHDEAKKLTTLNHNSSYEVSDDVLQSISEKIQQIRNDITGA